MIKYNKFTKNKKGFSIAQVLAYAVLSVIVLTAFFSITASVRQANMSLTNRNYILNEIYNIEQLQKEIRYSPSIKLEGTEGVLCNINVSTDADCSVITLLDRKEGTEKKYEFKDSSIVLTQNNPRADGVQILEIPQYNNVKSFDVRVIEMASEQYAIKLEVVFELNNLSYVHDTVIYPNTSLTQ